MVACAVVVVVVVVAVVVAVAVGVGVAVAVAAVDVDVVCGVVAWSQQKDQSRTQLGTAPQSKAKQRNAEAEQRLKHRQRFNNSRKQIHYIFQKLSELSFGSGAVFLRLFHTEFLRMARRWQQGSTSNAARAAWPSGGAAELVPLSCENLEEHNDGNPDREVR